jgi:hypothetical protein
MSSDAITLKGREVQLLEVHYASDPVDSYIVRAEYYDTEVPLEEDELDLLQVLYADELQGEWWEENMLVRADEIGDGYER